MINLLFTLKLNIEFCLYSVYSGHYYLWYYPAMSRARGKILMVSIYIFDYFVKPIEKSVVRAFCLLSGNTFSLK